MSRDGAAGSYTTLYRIGLKLRIRLGGSLEIQGLVGTLLINRTPLPAGQWVQIVAGGGEYLFSSQTGCEILAIVRGHLELVKR